MGWQEYCRFERLCGMHHGRPKTIMVESVLEAFQKDLIDSKVADSFQKSMIHGDLNDANVVLDSDYQVSGIIDFGGSVERYVLFRLLIRLSISLIFQTRVSGL
jgi:Ser/Thr protein kinase RdoA (MazF antagonist)